MTIEIGPELESVLASIAKDTGTTAAELALSILTQQLPAKFVPRMSADEFQRHLQAAASPCGVSLTDQDLSRETIYD